MEHATSPLKIFHIDDSDDDALIVARVLRQCPHPTEHTWFPSALDAMAFIEAAALAEMPDLILCDLKMPRVNGLEFIRWLRESARLATPVVVLSSSDLIEDIRQAYALGANSFLIKPLSAPEILEMMKVMVEYWRRCNLLERPGDL